ncbi:MAG TPA: type I polyketide synthase, partial [Phycisphaerae bacterium]|nr:type I polyketide synthase [Phycisphaerae bacterium]
KAIQASWNIDAKAAETWKVVLVSRSPAEVRELLAGVDHARLLIVNTPKECVVGGLADAVDRVVARLKCRAIPVEGVATVHCDAMQSVAKEYRDFHIMQTTPPPGMRVYSAALGASYDVNSETAADAISGHALRGFNFPAVTERAYEDGVRTFIEVGPQASCTRMIRKILGERPHLAVSASSSAESEWTSVLKLTATLIAHRLPVNLTSLYSLEAESTRAATKSDVAKSVTVPIGGCLGRPVRKSIRRRSDVASRPDPVERGAGELVGAGALIAAASATADAHQAFLHFSEIAGEGLSSALDLQAALVQKLTAIGGRIKIAPPVQRNVPKSTAAPQPAFDRTLCLEFARGKVANVLGPDFAVIDSYPVRVRLPDEPLMLVDRIMSIEGERRSLTGGRIVTEHEVHPDAWYLDGDRAPICITVESGQADLFLSSYLGIDFVAQGKRAYRLLDATVTFHRGLPRPGETIRYDIRIDRFVRQGETYLFFFEFDGTIAGQTVLTMRQGCAGFFTREEIEKSHGIVLTDDGSEQRNPTGFSWPLDGSDSSFDDARLASLRRGDLAGCFGEAFKAVLLKNAPRLPDGRMKLIDRVLTLEPRGGRFGLGRIVAEADIHPDDWFLTCHFVDDMVMPGTLMYECCVHTLRFFLMRMGWVAEADSFCYEPIAGVSSGLRCRGPVTPRTKKATYEIEIKEAGYRPEPYVIADALMYADGKRIVQMNDMSLQLTGLTREKVDSIWQASAPRRASLRRPVFTYEQIHAFAVGNPSECFGERFRVFDEQRKCARLPGPPYQFLDRITKIDHPQFELAPTSWIEGEYDVPPDAWYFASNRQPTMPFAVLLEIALQPCGFLAAYCGSAFTSETDLSFRNLGGRATLHEEVWPNAGTLRTRVRMTDVSRAGGMIIEKFQMEVLRGDRVIYEGDTSFGFFSAAALAQQVGIRDARLFTPDAASLARAKRFAMEDATPMPDRQFRMVDRIDCHLTEGGPQGLGFIAGSIDVDPSAWFFRAHFYQDPVWPGSLGLEALLQIMKAYALQTRPDLAASNRFEAIATGLEHRWSYRGQVIPTNRRVELQASITSRQDSPSPMIVADGFLTVDGITIYEMTQFGLRMVSNG